MALLRCSTLHACRLSLISSHPRLHPSCRPAYLPSSSSSLPSPSASFLLSSSSPASSSSSPPSFSSHSSSPLVFVAVSVCLHVSCRCALFVVPGPTRRLRVVVVQLHSLGGIRGCSLLGCIRPRSSSLLGCHTTLPFKAAVVGFGHQRVGEEVVTRENKPQRSSWLAFHGLRAWIKGRQRGGREVVTRGNEPRHSSWLVFHASWTSQSMGLPGFSPSPICPSSELEPAHIPLERGGAAASSLLQLWWGGRRAHIPQEWGGAPGRSFPSGWR